MCQPPAIFNRALSCKNSMVNWHKEYFNLKVANLKHLKNYIQQKSHAKVYEIDSFFYDYVYEQIYLDGI